MTQGQTPTYAASTLLEVLLLCLRNYWICILTSVYVGKKNDDPESPAYIPSIFGTREGTAAKDSQRLRRYEAVQRRRKKREENDNTESRNDGKIETVQADISQKPDEYVPLEKFEGLQMEYRSRMCELAEMKKLCLQGRGFPHESLLKEDDTLTAFYTGLPSHSVLTSVFALVEKGVTEVSVKLTSFQCFLLTLMKLRLNLANYDLAFRFCIHESTVSRILISWLQIMDVRLSPLIHWPEKGDLQKTMPWCFRPNYGLEVTSIIDCFEIFIEKPGDLLCRAATWSNYKHYNTAKYLISVTPQGTVNFVSKGYGGRVSDKFITEDCGYLQKLQPQDVVLADRGFNVEDSVAYRGATLNIPAFTRGKPQLDPKDVEATRKLWFLTAALFVLCSLKSGAYM